jgi:hypothetical protein
MFSVNAKKKDKYHLKLLLLVVKAYMEFMTVDSFFVLIFFILVSKVVSEAELQSLNLCQQSLYECRLHFCAIIDQLLKVIFMSFLLLRYLNEENCI